MLINNNWMFASNYPKPEVTFAHMNGERITLEKVTITTQTSSKSGAYPMGEGMIFLSDTI
jgi:hypothetical protein